MNAMDFLDRVYYSGIGIEDLRLGTGSVNLGSSF